MNDIKTASTSDARKRAEESRTVPAEDVILSQVGVTDTADFKAAAAECAMAGLDADALRQIAAAHARGDLMILDEPDPEPWALIPEGRANATVLRVNGVVGKYWLDSDTCVNLESADGEFWLVGGDVTSVEPVQVVPEGARVLGEDEVAVPRAWLEANKRLDEEIDTLVERAKRSLRVAEPWGPVYEIIRDLAAVDGGGER